MLSTVTKPFDIWVAARAYRDFKLNKINNGYEDRSRESWVYNTEIILCEMKLVPKYAGKEK